MCLSHARPTQEKQMMLPTKPFFAYKFVDVKGDKLVSPYRDFEWKAGIITAEQDPTDKMAGIYALALKPGRSTNLKNEGTLVRIRVNPEDVKSIGPDSFGGYDCECVVLTKCHLSEEDRQAALRKEFNNFTPEEYTAVKEVIKEARENGKKETTKKAVKAAKTTAAAKKLAKSAKRSPVKSSVVGKPKLNGLGITALRAIAKMIGLTGIGKLAKDELIKLIKRA